MPKGKQHGFTLIELMITVAIIGILSSIAYPSYRDYVLRGQIVDATNGLATLRANMERYFQDNRTYNSTGAFTSPCLVPAAQRKTGSFQLSCTVTPTDTTYAIQAAGSGSTDGFTYAVNQINVQSTTITGSSGWTSCATAWVLKRGQACP